MHRLPLTSEGVPVKSSMAAPKPEVRTTFLGGNVQGALMPERRGTTYFTDRRFTRADEAHRQTYIDRAHMGSLATRNRGKVTHEVRFSDTFNGLYSIRFSPGGDTMVTAFGAGAIQVRNPYTGELTATLRSAMDQASPVMCLRYHPMRTDEFYAASACGTVFQCNAVEGAFFRYLEEPKNEINTLDINLSGELLATGGKDATVRIYDLETAKLLSFYRKRTVEMIEMNVERFHVMRIFALRFHPQSREVIVTGGWDNTVKVWDVRIPDGSVRVMKGPHICGDAIDIKEKVVLTGSWVVTGSLQTWDFDSGKLIETVMPSNRPTSLDGEFLYTAQFFDGDPYGDLVCVGGSGTGVVEIISLKDKRVIGTFRVNKAVQALDSYGNTLCFGGMETLLRIGEFV